MTYLPIWTFEAQIQCVCLIISPQALYVQICLPLSHKLPSECGILYIFNFDIANNLFAKTDMEGLRYNIRYF